MDGGGGVAAQADFERARARRLRGALGAAGSLSPSASVDYFLKWSAVDLCQRREWPVGRIAER